MKTCENTVSLCAHLYTAAYFQHKYEEKSCQGQQNDHPSVLNTIRKPCNTNASRLGFCNLFAHSGTISEETKHDRAGETRRECPGICFSGMQTRLQQQQQQQQIRIIISTFGRVLMYPLPITLAYGMIQNIPCSIANLL